MLDQGVPYTITTPLGSISVNPNGFSGSGFFIPEAIDPDKTAESDVQARGFGDGSVIGQTRIPGLRYGVPVLVQHPVDADREDLENQLRGYISSMRSADGTIEWTAKDGSARVMRGVRALSVPRPGGRIGVYKKFDFEIACTRPYVEGEETETESTGLDLTGSGQIFPDELPWQFNSSGGGLMTCPNPGSTDEWPLFRITGPVAAPEIVRIDTQQRIVLEGLILASGDYVDVNMFDRSIMLNGVTSVRGTMRPRESSFFSIPPGGAEVRLVGTGFTSETKITAYTRGAFAA